MLDYQSFYSFCDFEKSMTITHFPDYLDPFKSAEQGFSWSGQLPLSRLKRLSADVLGDVAQQTIQLECALSMDNYHRFVWLKGQVQASVELECQRCLEPVELDLDADIHLAILNDERMIEHLPDEIDFVVLGENDSSQKGDFLNHAQMDLLALIEDELLLLLPFVPKHDDCEHEYQPEEIDDVVEEQSKVDNPFSILASLKKN